MKLIAATCVTTGPLTQCKEIGDTCVLCFGTTVPGISYEFHIPRFATCYLWRLFKDLPIEEANKMTFDLNKGKIYPTE